MNDDDNAGDVLAATTKVYLKLRTYFVEDFAYENMIGIVIDAQHMYTHWYTYLNSLLNFSIISF